jgi:hypothetical protein
MIDAFFTPVLVAAGFNEREHAAIVNDGGTAYNAVSVIMSDKKLADSIAMLDDTLEQRARAKHASTEPQQGVIAWAEWYSTIIKETKPYESVVLAVQMLEPQQRAALRARVLAKLKLATSAE